MSNRSKNTVIDDITSRNIDANLQDNLLNLFVSAMKSVSTTLVREAKFETLDFSTAKARGCEGLTLLMSRTRVESCNGWFGAFQRGEQHLEVIGHPEQQSSVRRLGWDIPISRFSFPSLVELLHQFHVR